MDPTEQPAHPGSQPLPPPTAPPPPFRPPGPPYQPPPPRPYMTGRPWQYNAMPPGGMPGAFQPHSAPQPWGFQQSPAMMGAVPQMRPIASTRVPNTQWLEVRTNTGGVYWHNETTGQGTWEKPPEVAAAAAGGADAGTRKPAPRPLDPAKAAMLARAKASGALVAPQYARLAIEAGDSSKALGAGQSTHHVKEAEEGDNEDDLFFTEEDIAGEAGGQQQGGGGGDRGKPSKPPVVSKAAVSVEEDFKALLAEKGVHGFSRYERELPKIQPDPRFIAVPSAHRRRVFEEYCAAVGQATKKKPASKGAVSTNAFKESVSAIKAAEDAFKALVQERVTKSSAQWHRVEREFSKDSRSSGVAPSRQEALFRTHIDSLSRAEEARERAQRRARHETHAADERRHAAGRADAMSNFKTLLAEAVHDATVSWTEVRPRLEQDPQGRATHPLLDPRDAEEAFMAHVSTLEHAAADAFVALLQEKRLGEGTAWEEIETLLQEEPRFINLPVDRRRALWDWHRRGLSGGAGESGPTREVEVKEDSRDDLLERETKRARRDESETIAEEGERS